MTPKTVAAELNGSEYPMKVTADQRETWKAAGIVVVSGASDDLMEFDGAIHDEYGLYGGGEVRIDADGILTDFETLCEDRNKDGLRQHFARDPHSKAIEAVWDEEGYSWVYRTDIPHETFEIMEDGEKYCRGIVFKLEDCA